MLAASVVCGLSMLALGCWAFLAPDSFAEFIAYPPFNEHLIHDAGAFQIGIGTAVLAAVLWSDALTVALAGFVTASALHTVSLIVDRHIGGHNTDAPTLGLLTALGVFAIYARVRWRRA
jgi:predicted anti-sigma-YlaC factor YlaD